MPSTSPSAARFWASQGVKSLASFGQISRTSRFFRIPRSISLGMLERSLCLFHVYFPSCFVQVAPGSTIGPRMKQVKALGPFAYGSQSW